MDLLTIEEARQRLGISDSTIRRWMRQGKIEAQLLARRYYFREQDVARLLTERHREDDLSVTNQQLTELKLHIASLDLEVMQLRERVTALEASQKPTEPRVTAERVSQGQEVKPRPTSAQSLNKALPDELVSFTDFYKAHGISETTARRDMQSSQFPVVSGSWQRGNNIIKQALDLSGQRAFCEYYAAKEKLQPCSNETCACHHVTNTE